MMTARRGIGAVVGTIRGNYESSAKDAMAILDESQQKTATDLLTKQKEEAEDMIREKLGGRASRRPAASTDRPASRPARHRWR